MNWLSKPDSHSLNPLVWGPITQAHCFHWPLDRNILLGDLAKPSETTYITLRQEVTGFLHETEKILENIAIDCNGKNNLIKDFKYIGEVLEDVVAHPLHQIGHNRWSHGQCFADILWQRWVLGTAKEDLDSLLSLVNEVISSAQREPDKKYTIAPEGLKEWKIDSMRIEPMKVVFDESGDGKVFDVVYIGSREYSHWLEEIRSWQNFLRELGASLADLFEFMIHAERGLCKVEGGEQAKQSSISLTFGELDKK